MTARHSSWVSNRKYLQSNHRMEPLLVLTYIVGLDVLVGVFHPVIYHHHCDSSASNVALPHPCNIDVHTLIEVIVLQVQKE